MRAFQLKASGRNLKEAGASVEGDAAAGVASVVAGRAPVSHMPPFLVALTCPPAAARSFLALAPSLSLVAGSLSLVHGCCARPLPPSLSF